MKKFLIAVITSGIMLAPVTALAVDIQMSGSVSMDDNLSVTKGVSGPRYAHAIVDKTDNLTWAHSTSLILLDNATVRLPVPQNNLHRVFTIIGVNNPKITTPNGATVNSASSLQNFSSVDCVVIDNASWACY
jgi:hypothetical protein